ncbi:MAG: ABC transporter ATP-binding protein [Oscillospiraceae bacterium]|nr:ABC transporter ATP-binding protein [Oscillospiraceae bacterium]
MKKQNLSRVLKHIGRYSPLLALSVFLSLIFVFLTLLLPWLAGRAIDIADMYLASPDLLMDSGRELISECVLIAVCACAAAFIQWVMNLLNNRITYNVLHDMRREAFVHMQSLDLSYIDSHPSGDLVSRMTSDADQFADGLLMGFTQLFTGVATIIGALIFMARADIKTALLVVALTPISMFVAKFISTHTYDMSRKMSKTRGEQTAYINEMLANQRIVRAFSQEKNQLEKFDEINNRLCETSTRAVFFSSLTNPSTRFINNLIYAVIVLAGAYLCTKNGGEVLTAGALTALLLYVNQYAKPFNEVSGVVTELQGSLAAAERLFDLIDEKEQISDADGTVLSDVKGSVEFKGVDFSYTPEKKLIQGLDLKAAPGQRIAIVGPTGCGKTTLINLLMRFYDVDNGGIYTDGTDIRSCTRRSLRQSIGMVLQETWLKSGTIRNNICMGKDVSDEDIINAAKASHAHSFIKRLPNGYDTVISEDGGSLSQGQKQLLCITRVMLALPPMLILDEATSSIDTRTEILINRAFTKMMKGRTSFVVAHRLSTVMNADIILVMKDGNIIEQGTHKELLDKGGFYSELFYSQFSGVR